MIDRYYERYGRRPMGVAADNTYGNGETAAMARCSWDYALHSREGRSELAP